MLDELDVEIHLVKEGAVLSRDSRSSEKFMHGIKVLMAKNYIDNLSEEARKGMQEKAEQGDLADQDAARLPQRHGPGRQKGHRHRSGSRPHRYQAVRVVFHRHSLVEGSWQEGRGRGFSLSTVGRARSKQHNSYDPAQPALHRPIRVERQAISG